MSISANNYVLTANKTRTEELEILVTSNYIGQLPWTRHRRTEAHFEIETGERYGQKMDRLVITSRRPGTTERCKPRISKWYPQHLLLARTDDGKIYAITEGVAEQSNNWRIAANV